MKQILIGLAIVFAVLGLGIALVLGDLSEQRAPGAGGAAAGAGGAITTISHGESVRIDDHLGSGLTVVEFYADW